MKTQRVANEMRSRKKDKKKEQTNEQITQIKHTRKKCKR